jgi:ubiquinone/menaquinone biosynthesis C-methylase UbiE
MPVSTTLERFDIRPGQTVLEVGPGPGYYSIEAARIVGPGGRLVCVDLQRGMLEILSDRMDAVGEDNVDMAVADAVHLPLRTGSIDRVFLVTVLGEVPDQDAALDEIKRVLQPEGLVGFCESWGDPDIVFLGKLRSMCARHGFEEVGVHRNPVSYVAVFQPPSRRPTSTDHPGSAGSAD